MLEVKDEIGGKTLSLRIGPVRSLLLWFQLPTQDPIRPFRPEDKLMSGVPTRATIYQSQGSNSKVLTKKGCRDPPLAVASEVNGRFLCP